MDGGPLSSTFKDCRHDETRRNNLYRGMSRIMLDLAKVPLPRIGSWKTDGRGVIYLTNRPLLDLTMLWNRHEIPNGVPRVRCFSRTGMIVLTLFAGLGVYLRDTYVKDLLSYQDLRLRHQPNAILGRNDDKFQLSALTALRALLPKFYDQTSRNDLFVLTLPDLHQSNIFVDDYWNVVSVIDFEFAPVHPQQLVGVPHWLSGKSIDELVGPDLDEYQVLYDTFVGILREEETAKQQGHSFSERLKEDWYSGKIWCNAALKSSNGFPIVFEQNLQPRYFQKFEPGAGGVTLMRLWGEDCEELIAGKLRDKAKCIERIRAIFAEAEAAAAGEKHE